MTTVTTLDYVTTGENLRITRVSKVVEADSDFQEL